MPPAIALARDGFPLGRFTAEMINYSFDQLHDHPQFAELSRVYDFNDNRVKIGKILKQPDLAATFDNIVSHGPEYLYRGPLGDKLVSYLAETGG